VSRSPSELLPDEQFGLYAVAARFPHNLSGQVPWQKLQEGVYDCRWGTDTIRVLVAGELPREAHNAPLHLFSASPELVDFASGAYQRRSEQTSRLLGRLFERLHEEGFTMSFTMEDFNRQYIKEHFSQLTPQEQEEVLRSLPEDFNRLYIKEHFSQLTPEEQREVLQALPPEKQREVLQALPPERRLAGLSAEQIRQYLDQLTAGRPAQPRKPRRKK
jgi:hypothetical protein